jgi:hypothetical protein
MRKNKYILNEEEEKLLAEIDVNSDRFYSRKMLMVYLKSMGLPFSRPTLDNLEKKGIFKSNRLDFHDGKNIPRVFTGKEILSIAESIRKYKRD